MAPHKLLLPHLPPTLPIYIAAYTSVNNSPHILSQLLSSNQSYNYTFLDARTLLSTTHLLSACFRALTDHLHNRLKSNNVHAEIVFCLSSNNNIGDAYRRFGIGEGSTEVVVVRVGGEEGEVGRGLEGKVEGVEVEWDGIEEWIGGVCNLDVVRKNYKIGKAVAGKKGVVGNGMKEGDTKKDEATRKAGERKEMERVVLGLMALRGAT